MNAFDRNLEQPAVLQYGDGDFVVMKQGRYVVCAVTGKPIPLPSLRYWSPVLQEAYFGPEEALKRWKETRACQEKVVSGFAARTCSNTLDLGR